MKISAERGTQIALAFCAALVISGWGAIAYYSGDILEFAVSEHFWFQREVRHLVKPGETEPSAIVLVAELYYTTSVRCEVSFVFEDRKSPDDKVTDIVVELQAPVESDFVLNRLGKGCHMFVEGLMTAPIKHN